MKNYENFEVARYNSAIYRVTNKDWCIALDMNKSSITDAFKMIIHATLGKEVVRLEHGRVSNDWYFMVK